jgi:competence protein ComEA
MRLGFLLSTSLIWVGSGLAQVLPDGPGKAETERLCKGCHELARSVSLRQDRGGWETTMKKMVAMGIKGSEQEFTLVLEYLVKNYPADAVPPLNVNKATAIELESRLSLRRSQATAVIKYRKENGDFKSIEDLKKVPGIDAEKIEAKKDSVVF